MKIVFSLSLFMDSNFFIVLVVSVCVKCLIFTMQVSDNSYVVSQLALFCNGAPVFAPNLS